MSVSSAACLRRVSDSSSVVTDAVSSVVARGVAVVAGSAEGPATTGEDDVHASGLEEVLIGHSTKGLAKLFERNLRGSMHR